MTNRKIIRERVDDISTWEFEGKLSAVLEHVQDLIAKHGPDAYVSYNQHFYYEYDNNPTHDMNCTLIVKRMMLKSNSVYLKKLNTFANVKNVSVKNLNG